VQGNAHGYDNRVLLDALARFPRRLRGVAITDTRIAPATLHDWHRLGMRGLRFHLFSEASRPGYVRGVGLDVFESFRRTMRELGWVMQVFCDWRLMSEVAATFREISREMPVIVDHMLNIPAGRGVNDAQFQALLRLVGEGHVHVKLSAAYRLSDEFPDYPDARPFHDALLRANPGQLIWGTDWPHPSVHASVMPDDGHLLDLFHRWTPDDSRAALFSWKHRRGCSAIKRLQRGIFVATSRSAQIPPNNLKESVPFLPVWGPLHPALGVVVSRVSSFVREYAWYEYTYSRRGTESERSQVLCAAEVA
jgi:predicted TIM-barrel fold metal-dependent hydrolase